MIEVLLVAVVVLLVVMIGLQLVARRRGSEDDASIEQALEGAEHLHERTERALREEMARSREEAAAAARGTTLSRYVAEVATRAARRELLDRWEELETE